MTYGMNDRIPCANTYYLNKYLDEQEAAERRYEIMRERAEQEVEQGVDPETLDAYDVGQFVVDQFAMFLSDPKKAPTMEVMLDCVRDMLVEEIANNMLREEEFAL